MEASLCGVFILLNVLLSILGGDFFWTIHNRASHTIRGLSSGSILAHG